MKFLKSKEWWLNKINFLEPAPPPHTHYYIYRSRICTLCDEYCTGPEPEYTPHLIINDRPVPAQFSNGKLVPMEPIT